MRTAFACLTLALVACTDLTEVPYGEVTEKNVKPSIGSLIAPAYTPLRRVWMGWYGNLDFQEETADELLTPVRPNGWYDGGTYISLHKHLWDATQGQPATLWGNAFSGINNVNRIIYQIQAGIVPVPDTSKPRLIAELRALRAYNYSLLLDNFGNVPIVTDFKATGLPDQATRQQVYDFVVQELTSTLPDLSPAKGTATYGRMNRWAAYGILARVYLNAEVYTGTPHYDLVLPATQAIMDSGGYALEAKYRAPFARNNDKSIEIIWAVPYDAINATESCFHMKTLKPELRFVFNLRSEVSRAIRPQQRQVHRDHLGRAVRRDQRHRELLPHEDAEAGAALRLQPPGATLGRQRVESAIHRHVRLARHAPPRHVAHGTAVRRPGARLQLHQARP